MKILKIFGIVVGIHVFALVLILANPGCSSSTPPPPVPADTAAVPAPSMQVSDTSAPAPAQPPVAFNPDAPAIAAPAESPGVRFTPTRPGTPAATTLVAEPVVDVTPVTTYTVKSGESLWTISRKHGLTVAQLSAANSLKTDVILRPGQKLLIPGQPASPTVAATANPAAAQGRTARTVAPQPKPTGANGTMKHVVKSGETLGGIARKYGVRTGDLAVANNISDPAKIRPGQELVIPGWQKPAAKKKAAPAPEPAAPKTTPPPAEPAPTTPPTINLDAEPQPSTPAPQVPVIRIDDGSSPIVPAPREP